MTHRSLPLTEPEEEDICIRMSADVFRMYQESIAANPPETFALLGGRLDDPFLITDFYFLPPLKNGNGKYVQSGGFVYPDHDALNYIIDYVFVPNSKYMLGLWHSHPAACTHPSAQDLEYCGNIIANDDSPGRRWRYFLAPITTFNRDGGDCITAWALKKGGGAFRRARIETPREPACSANAAEMAATRCGAASIARTTEIGAAIEDLDHLYSGHGDEIVGMHAYHVLTKIRQAAALLRLGPPEAD